MTARKRPARPGKQLTKRQSAFVSALLANPSRNYTNAAEQAGYENPGQAGWDLMNLPQYQHIQDAYHEQAKELFRRQAMDAEEWMARACGALRIDRRKILSMRDPQDLTQEEALLVKDFSEAELDYGKSRKVKLSDPAPFFMMVGKALGLFKERVQIDAHVEIVAAEQGLLSKLDSLRLKLEGGVLDGANAPGESGT